MNSDLLVTRHIRQQELAIKRLEYISKKRGVLVEKQICIMNLKNLSYSLDTRALATFHRTLAIDQAYYPERLQTLFMINAPWFFTATWAMVKNWIDPVTADKIKIVGSNFIDVLREHIDDTEIPPELGGSCPDFKWQWPWPDSTGISEVQLGYKKAGPEEVMDEVEEDDSDGSDYDDEWKYYRQSIHAAARRKPIADAGMLDLVMEMVESVQNMFKESIFNKSVFHLLFCVVCLCICNSYFFAVWSLLWDFSVALLLIIVCSQMTLVVIWSYCLLQFFFKLFELTF